MNTLLLGTSIGGLVAFLLAIPAIFVELITHGRTKDLPLVVDPRTFFGRTLSPRETFVAAVFLHVLSGALFGFFYVIFASRLWLPLTHAPYTLRSLLLFALGTGAVAGGAVYPLLGMGWFGRKEGSHAWAEILVSHLLFAVGMWVLVRYYQPAFF